MTARVAVAIEENAKLFARKLFYNEVFSVGQVKYACANEMLKDEMSLGELRGSFFCIRTSRPPDATASSPAKFP